MYIISQKFNVFMITDHAAFHGQLRSPEDTGISVVHAARELTCLVVPISHFPGFSNVFYTNVYIFKRKDMVKLSDRRLYTTIQSTTKSVKLKILRKPKNGENCSHI